MHKLTDLSKHTYYYLALAAVSVVYVTVSLLAPLSPNRFNLTPAKTHLLQLTILLPIVAIWWLAFYGAERLKSYTSAISRHKDGKPLDRISNGLLILVAAIILSGLFSLLRSWAVRGGWLAAFTVMSNYVAVVGPLVAFAVIYHGSRGLCRLIGGHSHDRRQTLGLVVLLAVVAGVYISVISNYDFVNSTPNPSVHSSFYMSSPLVFLTIAIPYLIGWWLGLKAVLNIDEYRRHVKGVIYKQFLRRLEIGIATVIAFYIVLQLLVAFSTFIARAGLSSILLVLYLLIISYGMGFLAIAAAAKKLNKIEKA